VLEWRSATVELRRNREVSEGLSDSDGGGYDDAEGVEVDVDGGEDVDRV